MKDKQRKYTTALIVALMSFALLGLIGVQLHWMFNAIDLKQDLFQQTVNSALANVANTLERQETIENVLDVAQKTKPLEDGDGVVKRYVRVPTKPTATPVSTVSNVKTTPRYKEKRVLCVEESEPVHVNRLHQNAPQPEISIESNPTRHTQRAVCMNEANEPQYVFVVPPPARMYFVDEPDFESLEEIEDQESQSREAAQMSVQMNSKHMSMSINSMQEIRRNYQEQMQRFQRRVWDTLMGGESRKIKVDFNEMQEQINETIHQLQSNQFLTINSPNGFVSTSSGVFARARVTPRFQSPRNAFTQTTYSTPKNLFIPFEIDNKHKDKFSAPKPIPAAPEIDAQNEESEVVPVSTDVKNPNAKLLKRLKMWKDVVTGLNEVVRPINQRINEHKLDSLIKAEFKRSGIDQPFTFVVTTEGSETFLFTGNKKKSDFESSPYKTALFVNDILPSTSFLVVTFANDTAKLLMQNYSELLTSAVFVLIIIGCFGWTLQNLLRHRKISEMKSDFINNMTHEFKTPIATIALATDALIDPSISASSERVTRFLGVIKDENQRLGLQVERVLQAARLEKGDIALSKEEVNIHQLIEEAKESIQLQLDSKGGSIACDLKSEYPFVVGDDVHLSNVLMNLLDNAIKYNETVPLITIASRNVSKGVLITVSDNGIGISKENQKRIFEKLYRVPTGNIHNVKGFGLGLSYAKAIVEAHSGTLTVSSDLHHGSTFEIYLPFQS